jgi:RimJ/RimL family protein N-acetyltransferase
MDLRLFTAGDATTFALYRNHEDVSRYQGWDLPFTVAQAQEMIDSMGHGMVRGSWVNLAIEVEGCVVGDIAIGLNTTGDEASLGFTIVPEQQKRGLATRAARMVMGELEKLGVRKFDASLHPDNLASVKVLEKLGFRHLRTDKESYECRGVMVDDAIYIKD